MAFRRADLQEAFFVPGTFPFHVWGHGTTEAQVLRPGCFQISSLRPGELIYVRSEAPERGANGQDGGAPQMALLMVQAGPPGRVAVRLVQDFGAAAGGPDGRPAGEVAILPQKRRRGRPPGSRNRKPA